MDDKILYEKILKLIDAAICDGLYLCNTETYSGTNCEFESFCSTREPDSKDIECIYVKEIRRRLEN